jgi:hypothetical protein
MKPVFDVTRSLEELIISEDPKSREEAARFLGEFAVQCIHQLRSKEPALYRKAWSQWRHFRDSDVIDALLDACEDDPAEDVRKAAQFAIDTIICESGIRKETQH